MRGIPGKEKAFQTEMKRTQFFGGVLKCQNLDNQQVAQSKECRVFGLKVEVGRGTLLLLQEKILTVMI